MAEGADGTDVAAIYEYTVIWFEHHGIRLYGVMGFLSKMLGVDGLPLRLLRTTTHNC